jgi:hypothetical protein
LKQRLGFDSREFHSPEQNFGHATLSTFERQRPEDRNESIGSRLSGAVYALDKGHRYSYEAVEFFRAGQNEEAKLKLKAAIQTYDQFLSSPDPPFDPKDGWSKDVQTMRSWVQIKRDGANNLLKLSEGMGKGEGEITLVFLSPYLLGLGLAVRIAKVTAKLVTVREKSDI